MLKCHLYITLKYIVYIKRSTSTLLIIAHIRQSLSIFWGKKCRKSTLVLAWFKVNWWSLDIWIITSYQICMPCLHLIDVSVTCLYLPTSCSLITSLLVRLLHVAYQIQSNWIIQINLFFRTKWYFFALMSDWDLLPCNVQDFRIEIEAVIIAVCRTAVWSMPVVLIEWEMIGICKIIKNHENSHWWSQIIHCWKWEEVPEDLWEFMRILLWEMIGIFGIPK